MTDYSADLTHRIRPRGPAFGMNALVKWELEAMSHWMFTKTLRVKMQ